MATIPSFRSGRLVSVAIWATAVSACALGSAAPVTPADVPKERLEPIRHAQVWTRTNVASMNLKAGPGGPQAFRPEQTVTCDYLDERLEGGTPKFRCAITPDDAVKVKYGEENGEVFGEVAASRLLWALGFPADAQYPVKVVCRGCSADPWKIRERQPGQTVFEYAAIERKYPARELTPDDDTGWAWPELELVDASAGGAPRAHRDALKLLAVFMQHTDSKPQQQRLICADAGAPAKDPKETKETKEAKEATCKQTFMIINDLGLTFGRANNLNKNRRGSTNLQAWLEVPIWKDAGRCVGYLSKSFTGTLEHPAISEAGRKFLADLLTQLSDAQVRDLFDVSRVSQRAVKEDGVQQTSTTDAWVAAFKKKRQEIVRHTCPS